MKILMLCVGDWGGSAYNMTMAINETTEHEARLISFHEGYTKYPKDIFQPSPKEVKELIEWCDVLNVHDDADLRIPTDAPWRPIFQTFRGTWYRSRPDHINARSRQRNYLTACMTQGLTRFGPTWIPKPVSDMSDMWNPADEFTVIHAPTKRGPRGTDAVIEACKDLEGVTLDLIENVSHAECLERKAKGHLLIDHTLSGIGKSAGTGFCGNALEAWAMGMPVISYAKGDVKEVHEKCSGELPFAKARKDLRAQIIKFRDDAEYYKKWQKKGRKYYEEYHLPAVVAARYIEMCERAAAEVKPHDPLKISLCMIIRNEEAVIEKAIKSAEKLCDEVVIVDTGSTDKSVEIAESLGAKVIIGGDRMHKAESRNRAIKESTGDWVIILDGDETIKEPEQVKFHINQTYADSLMVRIMQAQKGVTSLSYHQQRIWRKGAFWYKYRAHELPVPASENVWVEKTPYTWLHEQPEGRSKGKIQYTADRLEMDVEENQGDSRPLFYLARQYRYMSHHDDYKKRSKELGDKALEMMHKYIDMTSAKNAWDRPNGCFELAMMYEERKDFKSRIRALHLACDSQPKNRRWWAELARAYYEAGLREIGIGLMKAALEIKKGQEDGYSIAMMHGPYPHDALSQWCWETKRYAEGYEHIKEAVILAPDEKRFHDNAQLFRNKLG